LPDRSDPLATGLRPERLQLLAILEIYWKLKSLLEISWNLIAAPGDVCILIIDKNDTES